MYLKNASTAKKWQIQAETSTVNNLQQEADPKAGGRSNGGSEAPRKNQGTY